MRSNFLINNLYIYFFILLFAMVIDSNSFLTIIAVTGALISIFLSIRHWSYFVNELRKNRYLYISLAFFIPIGIALIDSPNHGKSFSVFSKMFLYVCIGVLAVVMNQNPKSFRKLELLTFWALVCISMDAISQWLFNFHIYGAQTLYQPRIVGIFGEHRYHLSYFLGTFSPIVLFMLYYKLEEKITAIRLIGSICILSVLIIAIVIGGARAGIISLTVSIFLFICYLFYTGKIKHKVRFVSILFIITILLGIFLSQTELVQARFAGTITAFGTDDFIQRFSAGRTNIWYVGFNEIPNFWINGMGPRAFNTIYQTYPESYKMFPLVWQPHLHGLEVLIETGVIGFIPYICICLYLFIRVFTAKAGNMWLAMGLVAMMPINSHVGIYQAFWMPIVWVPIMLGLTLAQAANERGN